LKLIQFKLENFRGIRKFDFDGQAPISTGAGGSGKTTVSTGGTWLWVLAHTVSYLGAVIFLC
jgi:predicted ATPase